MELVDMIESLSEISIDRKRHKAMPVYQQIHRKISEVLTKDADSLTAGDRLPSIASLARRLNVHYKTVQAAYDLLQNEGTIHYQPNKGAVLKRKNGSVSQKASQKMTVNFVTWHHRDGFFVRVAEGIQKYLAEQEINYSLLDVGSSEDAFAEAVTNVSGSADGLLVLPLERPSCAEAVRRAMDNGTKVVLVDRHLPGVNAPSVEPEHFASAYKATRHLLKLHKRPVYYLGITDKPSSCRDWVKGWSQAMHEYNFNNLQSHCFDLDASEEQLANSASVGLKYHIDAAMRLFDSKKEDIYCIFAGNDFMARGVYIAAEKRGLQVGRNVFVVGNDDMPFARTFDVPLSSIRQVPSIGHLGYEAAKLLHEYMIGAIEEPLRRLLPSELIARQSSTGQATQEDPRMSA
jgi:DNA-binding LacI/PurR family transcriptional regulator